MTKNPEDEVRKIKTDQQNCRIRIETLKNKIKKAEKEKVKLFDGAWIKGIANCNEFIVKVGKIASATDAEFSNGINVCNIDFVVKPRVAIREDTFDGYVLYTGKDKITFASSTCEVLSEESIFDLIKELKDSNKLDVVFAIEDSMKQE